MKLRIVVESDPEANSYSAVCPRATRLYSAG